jgi:hypothetical protein
MYVGWTLLYLGTGLIMGSRRLLVLLPLVLVITHSRFGLRSSS